MDRQKKLLIFVGAWVSALILTWVLYAKTVAPQEEKTTPVVVAARDMAAGMLLRPSDLKAVKYPEHTVPKGAILDANNAVSRVLLTAVNMNEPVLQSKLSGQTTVEGISSTIEPGYRAVSVQISDVSGVAGLILPNSHVDVLFTRPGTMAEATASTILSDVKVLSTGRLLPAGQTPDPRTPRSPVVTLVVTPAEAQKLELAKNEGKISLTLRNPLDRTPPAQTGPITTQVLDPEFNTRAAAARKGRGALPDARVWQDLAARKKEEDAKKKEPEKPRAVVDVYRGDKHVQEIFR
jgi:pilus assembly protein CpaB